jgi:thiol-disulfide isomerase/thioredoxin
MSLKFKYFIFLLSFTGMSSFVTISASDSFKAVIKYEDYEKMLDRKDNVLYVVNFWATWCGPCVEELPDFMKAKAAMAENKNFRMILVSLDNKRELDAEVLPFLKQKNITADVYLLDEYKRMNYWMPKVNKSWSGSIPATAFYLNGKQLKFVEKMIHYEELMVFIKQYIK